MTERSISEDQLGTGRFCLNYITVIGAVAAVYASVLLADRPQAVFFTLMALLLPLTGSAGFHQLQPSVRESRTMALGLGLVAIAFAGYYFLGRAPLPALYGGLLVLPSLAVLLWPTRRGPATKADPS